MQPRVDCSWETWTGWRCFWKFVEEKKRSLQWSFNQYKSSRICQSLGIVLGYLSVIFSHLEEMLAFYLWQSSQKGALIETFVWEILSNWRVLLLVIPVGTFWCFQAHRWETIVPMPQIFSAKRLCFAKLSLYVVVSKAGSLLEGCKHHFYGLKMI